MSKLVIAALATALLAGAASLLSPARAEIAYPWCAQYSGGRRGIGATNCGFVSLEQCRMTISGSSGICYENPRYPGHGNRPIEIRRRR